ncbi:iron-containing redox enzyme family protein [Aeromicrobium sp. A1-2]|uniref:iron-containing redox enzyme family protein n=1 Tax=Aeromicrobium sp. A1-2 TaxID=2107713 RepID=UPI000E51526E|nr:iron-containing redox enzyme family protein [Aeromicrobium sp. A1-2]AXT86706.1 iron-containing redox enzyme family protein [Aeromicrobium sp. A1-2]
MLLPKARGDLSQALFVALRHPDENVSALSDLRPTDDDDAQIALWTMYELHYAGFEDVDDSMEWRPEILGLRRDLETGFERLLRERHRATTLDGPFAEALFSYVEDHDGPSLAAHVHRHADRDQVLELLRHRSIYHLKESDPVAWVVPRLPTVPKAALMELQYDEYGGGDPNRLHSHLFALGLDASGLRSDYGAYIDDVPVETLQENNAMSLFGLHRRLRAAALGHLAAFETTSSLPSRRMAQGLSRLDFPPEIVAYYQEHVEADAVHEQLAVRTICGSLVKLEPQLVDDVVFGAFTCLDLADRYARRMLAQWAA